MIEFLYTLIKTLIRFIDKNGPNFSLMFIGILILIVISTINILNKKLIIFIDKIVFGIIRCLKIFIHSFRVFIRCFRIFVRVFVTFVISSLVNYFYFLFKKLTRFIDKIIFCVIRCFKNFVISFRIFIRVFITFVISSIINYVYILFKELSGFIDLNPIRGFIIIVIFVLILIKLAKSLM